MAFQSQDSRPIITRGLYIVGAVALACIAYFGLVMPTFGTVEKVIVLSIAFMVCWPLLSLGGARNLTVVLEAFAATLIYNGRVLGRVSYHEIEYADYTAEVMGNTGLRYVPVAGGLLYITTRPGFLLTVDLSRPKPMPVAWFMRMPVKRMLFTVDDPRAFLETLRRNMRENRA